MDSFGMEYQRVNWRLVGTLIALGVMVGFYAYLGVFRGDWGPLQFLAIGGIVLIPLERLMPRHGMAILRPQWLTDVCHVMFTSLLSVTPLIVLFPIFEPLRVHFVAEWIQIQPVWVSIPAALLVTEFLIYWGHRLSHTLPILWRFHAVHHSPIYLDWLAGERRHPVDGLYMGLFVAIPLLVTGFDLVDLLVVGVFNSLWDMTIHANLGWRLKFMDKIWVTTEYHHWHHSLDREARDKNFSGALPIWDIVFGSYYLPEDKQPGPYGIDEPMPEDYLGQLMQPFRVIKSESD